jgi:hypothetical protein
MKSLRKFAAIAVFTLGSLVTITNTASAQSAAGSFILPHEVIWQNATVPAGTYKFSVEPRGPAALLTLHKVSGVHGSFLMLVQEVGSSTGSGDGRLVMISRAGKSFVRTLDLPEFATVLHFAVPAVGAENELALASDTPVPTRLR